MQKTENRIVITHATELKPGSRYRESVARSDATRMTDFLRGKERDRALVELIAAEPTADAHVTPVYRVRVGPRVLFEATGMKPEKLAKELRALAESQAIDEELVLQYVEGRREALQRSGHYHAAVTYVFDARTDPNLTRIRVDVVEGPKFFVEAVRFQGNASISDDKLYGLMATHKKGLPLLSPGRLTDSNLAADAETILGNYQSLGWVRAKVPPPVVIDGTKPGGLVVTVTVEEGPRAFVESRTLEGADHLDAAVIGKLLSVKEGAPFNPNAVREDAGRLTAWYHDRGFREMAVHDATALSDDGTKARVTYRVDEGLKSFFGKTIIRGNTRTTTARIRRLVAWKEGEPVSESKLLDTQRALSRSGVFRRVEVRPQRPDPATQVRNVDIEVEEGRPWSLLYGVGYQYSPGVTTNQNDPYLAAGVSYNNVLGTMITAGLEAQYAPISGRGRVQAAIREPFLFGTSYPLNFLGFYSRELINTVELERQGLTLDSSKIVARGFRIGLRFTYERIRPTNSEGISYVDRVNLPAVNQPIHEAVIGPDFLFDRRDDIVDPRSGYYFSGSYKVAFPLLQASVRFQKFSSQAVGYVHLPFNSVFVVSGRVGGVFDVSPDAASVADCQKNPQANCVPIAERFYAGGRSNERAFDTDVLGIPTQTVDYTTLATPHTGSGKGSCAQTYPDLSTYDCSFGPRVVGGNGLLALNAEVRIPIAGRLAAVAFYDAAQVWPNLSDLRFTFEGPAGLRQGAGVGLRYMTPIGPVRVEYGWPLSPQAVLFDVQQPITGPNGQTIFIPLGHPRTTKDKGHFFFSVGYPF